MSIVQISQYLDMSVDKELKQTNNFMQTQIKEDAFNGTSNI